MPVENIPRNSLNAALFLFVLVEFVYLVHLVHLMHLVRHLLPVHLLLVHPLLNMKKSGKSSRSH